MKLFLYLLLIPALALRSFLPDQSEKVTTVKETEWLVGTWECLTPRGVFYENWVKENDRKLAGKSYYLLHDRDTVVMETVTLIAEHGKLVYIVSLEKENVEDEKPVRFTATSLSHDRFVVENPANDFPQVITYTQLSSDSLIAEISLLDTEEKEKHKSPVRYPMRRIK